MFPGLWFVTSLGFGSWAQGFGFWIGGFELGVLNSIFLVDPVGGSLKYMEDTVQVS